MSKFDDIYIELCKDILKNGIETVNRTVVPSIKIPFYSFKVDVGQEFPILTTKQVFLRQAVLEIMWIWIVGSNDVRWLQERNVHIWDEWQIDKNGYWVAAQHVNEHGAIVLKKVVKDFGKQYAYTIGTAYGYIIQKYQLLEKLLFNLKNHVNGRRNVVSLWQEEYLDSGVLPPCVWSTEWDVTNGKLNLMVHQRSCDVALGLPFNVSQYAVLLMMVAAEVGLEVGELMWTIKDAHIYINQVDGIQEQIRRYDENGSLPAPKVTLMDVDSIWEYPTDEKCSAIKVEGYKHLGKIVFPIAQ